MDILQITWLISTVAQNKVDSFRGDYESDL